MDGGCQLSAQNNDWTKREAKIFKRNSVISQICITLAGMESAIVVKRHLLSIPICNVLTVEKTRSID